MNKKERTCSDKEERKKKEGKILVESENGELLLRATRGKPTQNFHYPVFLFR
jgi:hypothetical protein